MKMENLKTRESQGQCRTKTKSIYKNLLFKVIILAILSVKKAILSAPKKTKTTVSSSNTSSNSSSSSSSSNNLLMECKEESEMHQIASSTCLPRCQEALIMWNLAQDRKIIASKSPRRK